MNLRKRPASGHDEQSAPKSARVESTRTQFDQELDSSSDVLLERFGDFQIKVKFMSALEAAENDEDNDQQFDDEDNENDDVSNDSSECDPEWDWLDQINVKVTSSANSGESERPTRIAYCRARMIRRARMRHRFYEEMEEPSRETSMLAFHLFDRYGRLRSEFKTHPIMKGTGVWGQELDHGDMLLIEEVFVNKEHRKQGLGRRMIESLLKLARNQTFSFFAFVWPTFLRLGDLREEWDSLNDDAAKDEMETREHDRAVMFYRSLGFRRVGSTIWFAMAPNNDHPAQQLAATEDFNPPRASRSSLHPLLNAFQQSDYPEPSPLDRTLNSQPREPPDFLGALHNCMHQEGSNDACWTSTDKYGNTFLHLAASMFDEACVEWILGQDFGTRLLQLRNDLGETPLELLQFKLESIRTQKRILSMIVPVSDEFRGHSDSAVCCLILLKELGSVESVVQLQGPDALLRICMGCTCGQCLAGFLSPRMLHALQCQAEEGYAVLDDDIDHFSGPEWVEFHEHRLVYLPFHVQHNLGTNNSMRQGFTNLWRCVATCLDGGRIPSESNILGVVQSENEWPPVIRNFFRRGGSIEPVFLSIRTEAMDQDKWTGDGFYPEAYGKHTTDLPECRNDHEFGFVSGMCGYRRISVT